MKMITLVLLKNHQDQRYFLQIIRKDKWKKKNFQIKNIQNLIKNVNKCVNLSSALIQCSKNPEKTIFL